MEDGTVTLHHELIQMSQHWGDLRFEGACLSTLPRSEGLTEHEKPYKLFEAAQNLRRDLAYLLNAVSDG